MGVLVIAIAGYLLSRSADNRSRQEARDLQTTRHAENTKTLEHLTDFKREQEAVNKARDLISDNLSVMAGAAVKSLETSSWARSELVALAREIIAHGGRTPLDKGSDAE